MSDVDRKKSRGRIFERRLECRESNFGLRELECAIRNAYVRKELEAQMRESEADRLAARNRERLFDESVKRSGEEILKKEDEERRLNVSLKRNYGAELKDAVIAKDKERSKAREIDARERRIFEEVSRLMEEREEGRKIRERCEIAAKKSKELRIFEEVREIRRDQALEKLEEKEAEDLDFVRMIEGRNERIRKAREDGEKAREAIVELVASSLLESRERKLEVESIVEDLVIEEKLIEEERRIAEDEGRRKAAREEAAIYIERRNRFIEERKRRHAKEEEEFAADVMRRVLQNWRLERLTAEAKRRKKIEYRRALELVIVERRNRRDEEMLKIEESIRLDRIRDAEVDIRVKEMRENLLLRHAGNVAQFIPIGALSLEERKIIYGSVDSGLIHPDKESATK